MSSAQTERRVIGRWFIGETLGKGGYSFVKKGEDVKTGKLVALKFMEKADSTWLKEQGEQVETEINSLKNIRHKHVMKLYAYNLSAQYPTKEKGIFTDTILLVLEFAPGGELFDILYYTSKLEPIIARTYFRQLVDGLEACHKASVVHRDLKPQNLLLDAKYNLKITDFGLSKIVKDDEKMQTTYVGTRGYQAPELLLKHKYDSKCDVFSAGVILFILLAGYPPFEQAWKEDKWYRSFIKENYAKFWKCHQKSQAAQDEDSRELIQHMLMFDPAKRASLEQIKASKWYNGPVLEQADLIRTLRVKHKKAEEARNQDIQKMKDLNQSLGPNKAFEFGDQDCQFLPCDQVESVHTIYAHGGPKHWAFIYNFMEQMAKNKGGKAEMTCLDENVPDTEKVMAPPLLFTLNVKGLGNVTFSLTVYRSREFDKKKIEDDGRDNAFVYVVDVHRVGGDIWAYKKLKADFLMLDCAHALNGLPNWAKAIQKDEPEVEEEDAKMKDAEDDDYYKVCEAN